jgi:hypothetical protein
MSPSRHSQHYQTQTALCVGILSVGIFIAFHPLVWDLFSVRFLGGSYGDGGLYVWLTQSFMTDPASALRLETNGMYPYPLSRAWSDSFLLPSLAAYIFSGFGCSLSASYNLVLLGAIAANGAAMYLFASKLGVERFAAVAVALVCANASYFIGNLGHPQLLFFFWVLLAWGAVLPDVGIARAPARRWYVAGLCVAGAFYCAVYFAIFAALGLAVIWAEEYVRGISSPRRAFRTVLLSLCGALPIVYALPSYWAVQGYFGTRGAYEAEAFAATGLSYLSFTAFHDLYSGTSRLSHSEAWLCAGYVPLLLGVGYGAVRLLRVAPALSIFLFLSVGLLCVASSVVDSGMQAETLTCLAAWGVFIAALMLVRKQRSSFATFVLIASICFVFSFGPGGNPVKGEPAYSPLGILYERAPGLSAIRAVGRYGVVVIVAIFILAGKALSVCATAQSTRVVAAAGLLVVGLLENRVSTIPFDAPREPPQVVAQYAKVARPNEAAVIVPFGGETDSQRMRSWSELAVFNTQYVQWSSRPGSEFRVVNGYSGQRSKFQVELPDILSRFPSEESFAYLGRLCGVNTILVAPPQGSSWDVERFKESLRNWNSSIVERHDAPDGSMSLRLAERAFTATPGSDVTLFGPRNANTRISLATKDEAPCEVTVSSLVKSKSGEVTAVVSEQVKVSGDMELYRKAPAGVSQASPHIIQISTRECSVVVGCGT